MVFQSHIGILAFPFGTHAAPLLAVVQRLAALSPTTLFSFFNSAASNNTIFNSNAYENVRAHDVWDGTPQGEPFTGTHFEAVGLFLKASPGNFEKAIEEAEEKSGGKVSCLITDAFLWFAADLSEKRGVPWVAFWTAASCSLSAHMYTHEILKAIGDGETPEEINLIPGLGTAPVSDLPPEIFLDKNPSPLAITINNMVENLPRSTAVVLNSFEEIDPIITEDMKSKFKNFLNVGPSILCTPALISAEDETGCLSWLENQSPKSVVYISFGTVITPPPNELAALAEALETCNYPFLWSLRDAAKKSLPLGFLDRAEKLGKIVPWAPQARVLAHGSVGAFVTHCGWNSVAESIAGGVPVICRPFFGDQKLNSRMVADSWRIGLRVEGGVFTKSGTIEVLKEVMEGEAGGAMRENVDELKKKAETAVAPEGSSFKNFEKLLEIITASDGR